MVVPGSAATLGRRTAAGGLYHRINTALSVRPELVEGSSTAEATMAPMTYEE